MVKVKCKVCGSSGYTASPNHLICECGGRFKVIPEKKKKRDLGSAFLILVFTLEIISVLCIYSISEVKKLYLLTSAGVVGGLREVSLKGQDLSRAINGSIGFFYFKGQL